MDVHIPQAGDQKFSLGVNDLYIAGVPGDSDFLGDRSDAASLDCNIEIFLGRRAGRVDDGDLVNDEDLRVQDERDRE